MEENKITKVLYNQVALALSVIGVVSAVIFWLTNPTNIISQRVGSLEQTIEYQSDTLDEIKTKVNLIDSRQVEMLQAIARLEAKK